MKNIRIGFAVAMLVATTLSWSNAAWIYTKARLAQYLIADAWESTLRLNTDESRDSSYLLDTIKPWSWADIWPVARLQWLPIDRSLSSTTPPAEKEDLYVLSGAHGEALSFGPGHLYGTSAPGAGLSVIGGHRDTHFEFLNQVKEYDLIKLQTPKGYWKSYRVQAMEVRHINNDPLLINDANDGLILITCYPFNSLNPSGPLRYVVWATPDDALIQKIEFKAQTPLTKNTKRNSESFTI